MLSVFKKELRSFFGGVIGYLFIAFLLCFTGIYVTSINLYGGYSSFEYVLSNIIIVFLLIVPLLTMRSFAEERAARTDKLLYSLPMRVSEIVLGKYFAMLTVFAIPVLIMALYPLLIGSFGTVALKSAYLALFGFFMLGAALIAICMFMSSLTESQVIAAVISFGTLLLMYMMNGVSTLIPTGEIASLVCFCVLALAVAVILYLLTKNYSVSAIAFIILFAIITVAYIVAPSAFEGLFPALITYLAVFERFNSLTSGIFDVTAIVYLITFAVFFVYLTVQSVEKRRWI
ncbi:MAG: ABC transporter [Ruminococcaceae bacterium]|nr:ABC transporter [Oscillospiraceae bacterium]